MPEQDNILKRMNNLRERHADRRERQNTAVLLARGIDPRSAPSNAYWNYGRDSEERNRKLHTNDPQTYLGLSMHLLAGRPVAYKMPSWEGISNDEAVAHGKAERFVNAIMGINTERLIDKGMPRFNRAIVDSAIRMGMVAIYRHAAEVDGNTTFIMEPWNPMQISERMDDQGLGELVRDYEADPEDFKMQVAGLPGWDHQNINRVADANQVLRIGEYWSREYVIQSGGIRGESRVFHTVYHQDGTILKQVAVEEGQTSIPVEVVLVNGESFPGEKFEYQARSILEDNIQMYLDDHDNLSMIQMQARKAATGNYQEGTAGGRPVADIRKMLDPRRGPAIQSYDVMRGETGLTPVGIHQLDPAIQIFNNRLSGFIQRGSVPHALHGALDFVLSGFAISQILEAALSSVEEAQFVLQLLHARLGRWILDTAKEGAVPKMEMYGLLPGQGEPQFFLEDINPSSDLPTTTRINALINLAQPSDLIERINMMAVANPGRQQLFSLRTIYEKLAYDLVEDPIAEEKAVDRAEIMQLPAMQMLQARRELLRLAQETSDPFEQQIYQEEADKLMQAISGSGQEGAPTRRGSGVPDPRALSTPARERGVPGANGREPAPQRAV
jgi:hypothetical protein